MDNSRNRSNENLGVNKMGKNIRKSPLHQPNFGNNNAARTQPQPQVYNINKNDFRSIVQQLTGSPSQEPLPRPPTTNPSKPQSMRLQKIRPPPLAPINRPHFPTPVQAQAPVQAPAAAAGGPPPVQYSNSGTRPAQFGHPYPVPVGPMTPGDSAWGVAAESPITAYMRYLQHSMLNPSPMGNQYPYQCQPNAQPQAQGQAQAPPQSHMLPQQPQQAPHYPQPQSHMPPQHPQQGPHCPHPPLGQQPSSQAAGQAQAQKPPSAGILPTPGMPPFPSPRMNGPMPPMPNLQSPRFNGGALLPSPTSQFLLPSPTGYLYPFSPRSPHPLLSPGIQHPPPLTPTFPFSAISQPGILGPGPLPPPSPGLGFPLSPSGFFPMSSPRW